ncbi:flavin-dependent dehydrogenase [Bradyrhizobium huanghuaihaiense]
MPFDVVVIGAGPAGSVAAHRLASADRSVLLLDPRVADIGPSKPGDALPGAALRILSACGLPSPAQSDAHRPIGGNVSAWGGAPVYRDFLAEPDGPGWRLNRSAFEADLIAAARAAGVVTLAVGLRRMSREREAWRLDLHGETASARWLIDATGRRAVVSQQLGARRHRDEPLVALVGHARADARYRMERNLVETTADGWWYAALLPNRGPVFMLHTRPMLIRSGLAYPHVWRSALASTHLIAPAFPNPIVEGPLRAHEACGSWLAPVAGDGWVACGDAALSFDPCAGQGLLSALKGGMAAADAVALALEGDMDQMGAYVAQVAEARRIYRQRVQVHYAQETRWRGTDFWSVEVSS